jgi:hypothetical protein
MTRPTARVVQRALNVIGMLIMTLALGPILQNYAQLYELATAGSSSIGRPITDFPNTLIPHLGVFVLGFLILELGQ